MLENKMYRNELRQRMEVAVSTYERLNGCMPGVEELYNELGSEYAPVILEYAGQRKRAAV